MVKVLVIKTDARARLAMVKMLNASDQVEVIGISSSVMQAQMQVKMRQPDALVMDADLQVDAVDAFLNRMMEATPVPVVLLSRQVLPNSNGARKAIRAGVATWLVKPADPSQAFDVKLAQQIRRTVQHFPDKFRGHTATASETKPKIVRAKRVSRAPAINAVRHRPELDKLIAIGASTGGTEALKQVIAKFPADSNAVVIVQHIPKAFAASFIANLDKSSPMHVVSAEDGAEICRGYIYVGAGDEHFTIERNSRGFICRVGGKERVSGHCPSVNELFDSVAKHAGSKAVGALMTGMGEDGATGLLKMRDARAETIAQDKASSVVWGMPGSAVKIGAAREQASLDKLGDRLIQISGYRATSG